MVELIELTRESINLVIPSNDDIENLYITGGFSKNPLFLLLMNEAYPSKKVYTSEINNATALGAALLVYNSIYPEKRPPLNLGLTSC
jgi:sugar (pentulose or hexulose) kinase